MTTQWPDCERYTYRGAGTTGRCWVCTEADGEEPCAWCAAEQWRVYNEDLIGAFRMREERERLDARPYRALYTGIGRQDRLLRDLVAECGSAPAAIAWIRSHPIYLGDFEDLIVFLECWDLTFREAHVHMHQRWANDLPNAAE
jgi:hypothetical protein